MWNITKLVAIGTLSLILNKYIFIIINIFEIQINFNTKIIKLDLMELPVVVISLCMNYTISIQLPWQIITFL